MTILGSPGSVGEQAIDVARQTGAKVNALCANRNAARVEEQAREFGVTACAMSDEEAAKDLKARLADTDIRVYAGMDGVCEMIGERYADDEVVLNSVIGEAGLRPTLAALTAGKKLALANKESLVCAGEIVMSLANEKNLEILPVDSEHCAIFQCLRSGCKKEIKRILLTASGGPFYGCKKDQLTDITVERALAHPTWNMGAKITIDSATLMNKGFEVIEASHLFGIHGENIDVLVHRESIIHSMVEFCDNSVIAQLSVPDMRLCVQYAVEAPDRFEAVIPPLDLAKIGTLNFALPDMDTFVPLRLTRNSLMIGGAAPAILHSANEVAVAMFLDGKIGFTDIFDTLEYVCGTLDGSSATMELDNVLNYVDRAASLAKEYISRL